ncbi:hypothetical protein PV08_00697 [Exophiala spinifera]|uniref:D-xylose 1-dehydrogenase (NADP(+), D-xylono-1,5-lactone-forming) n=1 Tax=Exophiala spinifera TaxID=91928 RepID=A0A0D2A5S4_9EURO|nr:uncharacterized protein PV08_00697 [Exophiala spinifera]KIW20122.1 hypothetical protein PV08_00697 [Exophiala spinifera]
MSWVGRLLLYFHDWNNIVNSIIRTTTTKKLDALASSATSADNAPFRPLRIGVLGAAEINYLSIIEPVSTHPTALITAIAARDKSRAEAQIASFKASLPGPVKAYGSYDEVLADGDIDAVYIPLPNSLHYRWAVAALEAGKHVLVEKPVTSNAREARALAAAAHRTGKVALEAFHWLFHPAAHTVKAMLTGGEYGRVVSVTPTMFLPAARGRAGSGRHPVPVRPRWRELDGLDGPLHHHHHHHHHLPQPPSPESGASTGARTGTSTNAGQSAQDGQQGPERTGTHGLGFKVLEATPRINATDKLIDDAMNTVISFSSGDPSDDDDDDRGSWETKAITACDLYVPKLFGLVPRVWVPPPSVKIECERAEIQFTNFAGPWLGHAIVVTPVTRDAATGRIVSRGKKGKPQKCYVGGPVWELERDHEDGGKAVGEEWWTTYRYQLEGFVRKIREVEERREEEGKKNEDEDENAQNENRDVVNDEARPRSTSSTSHSKHGRPGYVYRGPWVSLDLSVRIMDVIDAVYEKAGLPVRGE